MGINEVPCAVTVQRGNSDKKHFRYLLNVAGRVLDKGSLLIFDAGANSRANKERVVRSGFNYLTLKPKKVRTYKRYVRNFWKFKPRKFELNNKAYYCVKLKEKDKDKDKDREKQEWLYLYVYFSPDLLRDQLRKKEAKFERQKLAGNKLAKKVKKRKPVESLPFNNGWVELYPPLQLTLGNPENPYITGIEGFFILESSLDADEKRILELYKQRDKAEKFSSLKKATS